MDQEERRGEERGLLFPNDTLEKHVADGDGLSKILFFLQKSVCFWKRQLINRDAQLQELPDRLLNWPWLCILL